MTCEWRRQDAPIRKTPPPLTLRRVAPRSSPGGLLSSYASGALLETLQPRQIFTITAAFPLLVCAISVLIDEAGLLRRREPDSRHKQQTSPMARDAGSRHKQQT